jgi:hypothetical protein
VLPKKTRDFVKTVSETRLFEVFLRWRDKAGSEMIPAADERRTIREHVGSPKIIATQ